MNIAVQSTTNSPLMIARGLIAVHRSRALIRVIYIGHVDGTIFKLFWGVLFQGISSLSQDLKGVFLTASCMDNR